VSFTARPKKNKTVLYKFVSRTFKMVLFAIFFSRLPFFSPDVVCYACYARLSGAVGAAEKVFLRLNAVTNNLAAAMSAHGCKTVNRALETIENVPIARRHNFKR
jgi:hypothetical protein